jgi:hypothetical protein
LVISSKLNKTLGTPATKSLLALLAGFFCFFASQLSYAEEYLSEQDFLSQQFAEVPAAKALWITGELKNLTAEILQHPPAKLRQRYWQSGTRSVWVMDEIGKEKPITVGIVVNNGVIELVKVLAFRESRGWEIRYPFFTKQFDQVSLTQKQKLNKTIDNITGATLSVRAVRKLAQLALIYHARVTPSND